MAYMGDTNQILTGMILQDGTFTKQLYKVGPFYTRKNVNQM